MTETDPFQYPAQRVHLHAYSGSLEGLIPRPTGQLDEWPLIQVTYLENYLNGLKCATIIEEDHYLDRDYIEDLALFYSRSLRNYPNHCRRLHFLSRAMKPEEWKQFIARARGSYETVCEDLTRSYLGFAVVRPIPGRPIGRTVLASFGPTSEGGTREFRPLRSYRVHLSGLTLEIRGLAFQQQDQGVSACATTAVWTALHGTAHRESIKVPTPAEITLAASRYLLMHGRTLPSEGLAIQQICEAIRDAGLAPVLLPPNSLSVDRGALDTFLRSGFPVVLAVMSQSPNAGPEGHAICAVGAKVGEVNPQTDPQRSYRDGATALKSVYVHDDRLGPYAVANLEPLTVPGRKQVQTSLRIRWPGTKVEEELLRLYGIVVPVPNKVRLSVTRVRWISHIVGEAIGAALPELARAVTVRCRYCPAVDYQRDLFSSKLTDAGLERLVSGTALSRYIAVIEVSAPDGPLADLLLDCTEAVENPSAIAVVNRSQLPATALTILEKLATSFGASLVQ